MSVRLRDTLFGWSVGLHAGIGVDTGTVQYAPPNNGNPVIKCSMQYRTSLKKAPVVDDAGTVGDAIVRCFDGSVHVRTSNPTKLHLFGTISVPL